MTQQELLWLAVEDCHAALFHGEEIPVHLQVSGISEPSAPGRITIPNGMPGTVAFHYWPPTLAGRKALLNHAGRQLAQIGIHITAVVMVCRCWVRFAPDLIRGEDVVGKLQITTLPQPVPWEPRILFDVSAPGQPNKVTTYRILLSAGDYQGMAEVTDEDLGAANNRLMDAFYEGYRAGQVAHSGR